MPIPVSCECGARLQVRDEAVGKLVKCPKCQAVMTVPKPGQSAEDTGFQIVEQSPAPAAPENRDGLTTCPACGKWIRQGALICRFCRHRMRGVDSPPSGGNCPSCGAANLGNVAACPMCGQELGGARRFGETPHPPARPRNLAMEAHLRAIAIWWRIGGILGIAASVLILFAALFGAAAGRGRGSEFAAGLLLFMAVFVMGLSIAAYLLGHHLARYSNGARIAAGILTILGLLGNGFQLLVAMGGAGAQGGGAEMAGVLIAVLVSTAWSIALLWALFNSRSSEICTEDYRANVARTPSQEPPTYGSPFFWVPLIGIALVLILAVIGGLGAASAPRRGFHL